MKKRHQYKISVEHTMNPDSSIPEDEAVEFSFSSHDEILNILEKLRNRADIPTGTAEPLGLGIKLLGGVLLENKNTDLFTNFMPHFSDFMKALKKSGQS